MRSLSLTFQCIRVRGPALSCCTRKKTCKREIDNSLPGGVQEFAALPLRLSRQLTLDTVNAAAVALGRLLGARRAAGGPNSAAGEAAGAARVAAGPPLTGHASLRA